MNRIFNLIWSETKAKWIVVSEKVKGNGKVPSSSLRSIAVLAALFASGGDAYALDPGALPTGAQIVSGRATVTSSVNQMTVNQSTQKMIANWQSFNIGSEAAVRFNQPGTSSAALNRIADQNPTQIMGSLSANGQVFLLNQSGIIFGKTAKVNVGGLVASSLNMLDSDFLAGKYTFSNAGKAGSIQNQGNINASNGGVVALIAPKVTNDGSITANSGSVLFAAGNKVSVDFTGDGLISYTVDEGAVDALVENNGLIKADGGLVVMTAQAADALKMANATNTGVIEARTIENKSGRILLLSSMENGTTNVSGTLDASAPNGGDGGFIETSGSRVKVADGTVVTTLAPQGNAGTWLLDPTDFTISAGSVSQTNSGIGATTLQTNLGSGNVSIATSKTANGTDNGDINVNAPVSWSTNKLTLEAIGNININADVDVQNNGSLDLKAGYNSSGGTYSNSGNVLVGMNADGSFKGQVSFFTDAGQTARGGKGFLTINGVGYTVITKLGKDKSSTGTDLQGMDDNHSGHFALGADINAGDTVNWKDNPGFNPIGSAGAPFTGMFNGLGHTISKLYTDNHGYDYTGLFRISDGLVSNVYLENVNITAGEWGGSLAGMNRGKIINCAASGIISSSKTDLGGLVGNNAGTIINSYASVSVSGSNENVGGLVGHNQGGTIERSHASGEVVGHNKDIGGLVGYNTGTISGSNALGDVNSTRVDGDNNVGGLVGNNTGTISGSNASGNVAGKNNNIGGLVGWNEGGSNSISDCYTDGNVIGRESYVGGLVGQNKSGDISNSSHATGRVSGLDVVGGLVGENQGSISKCLVSCIVDGRNKVGGLVGQNKSGDISNSSHDAGSVSGVDQVGGLVGYVYNDEDKNILSISGSYATGSIFGVKSIGGLVGESHNNNTHGGITISECYATGDVTANDRASIGVGGLIGYSHNDSDWGNYGTTIINAYATGKVTGNGTRVGGLVGNITTQIDTTEANGAPYTYCNSTTVTNCYASGDVISDINGSYKSKNSNEDVQSGSFVGGLVGYNEGYIKNSYAIGNVTGYNNVGGLVGGTDAFNHEISKISYCYAQGEVLGSTCVGGLVGSSNGELDTNFATGRVSGIAYLGGLVGLSFDSSIDNSYATGSVSYEANSLSNTEDIKLYENVDIGGFGGLVGFHIKGNIKNSYATGEIIGNKYVGGLVGSLFEGGITNCYSTGNVTGVSTVGGLVGCALGQDDSKILTSYATGDVLAISDTAGGLVGFNNCARGEYEKGFEWFGAASSVMKLGTSPLKTGIVQNFLKIGAWGLNLIQEKYNEHKLKDWKDAAPIITDCYVTGDVEAKESTVGGLIGSNMGHVTNCYSWSKVTYNKSSVYGALFGMDTGEVTAVYFNTDKNPGMPAENQILSSKTDYHGYSTTDFQSGTAIWGVAKNPWDKTTWTLGGGPGTKPELKVFSPVSNNLKISGGNWSTETNWSAGHVPTIFETASIGNKTVNIDSIVMVNNLVGDLGGQLNFTGQTVSSLALNTKTKPLVIMDLGQSGRLILTGNSVSAKSPFHIALENIARHSDQMATVDKSLSSSELFPVEMPMSAVGFSEGSNALEKLAVLVLREPQREWSGSIGVVVPGYLTRPNAVFSFELPDKVKNTIAGSRVAEKVTLLDGGSLPQWLEYNSGTKSFTASNVPQGSMPLNVVIQVGDKSWVVEITSSQSNTVAMK